MTKLWEVEVEFEMIVAAETEEQAAEVARQHAREEASNALCWASPLERPYNPDWRDSCPYGLPRGDYRTVQQIFEANEKAERERPPTTEEIEAAGQQRLIA